MVPVDGFRCFRNHFGLAYPANRREPDRDRRGFCLYVHCLYFCGGHTGYPDETQGMVYDMSDGESARKNRQDPKKSFTKIGLSPLFLPVYLSGVHA
jgi:hypothetical protein